ncbi:hypothetical protein CSIRO_0508 [Bradyrhizobiaceae bacterium SG-6C]|nr:hypothetical protein CSIRO_0508 [Bradyrhizobiaceae bacterium SG-6C]
MAVVFLPHRHPEALASTMRASKGESLFKIILRGARARLWMTLF